MSPVERSVWKSMGDDGPTVHFRFPSLSQKRRFLKLSNIYLNQPTYKASVRTSDKNLTSPFCSRYSIIYYLPEKERKVVNKRSFRPHNCKTDHITSCKGRELLWNVHKLKAYKTTVFHCWICTFLTFERNVKEMLYAVRCLKSNEDMILALAGQFKQLSHEPEKFRWLNGIRTRCWRCCCSRL